ncbi:MAG TPA: hypothetical protein VI076_00570 [Actinopolymorphaceae bacterium]
MRGRSTGTAPLLEPLAYPGPQPATGGIVTAEGFLAVERARFDRALDGLGVPVMTERPPVLAIGSNACVSQVQAKFETVAACERVVPLEPTTSHDVVAGVSAHVSRPGYVPATPIPAPGERRKLFVLWLSGAQIALLDRTEPNYDRVELSRRYVPELELPAGTTCQVYVSEHGWLVDRNGVARRLVPQRELIGSLLGESDALRALAGPTPETWIARMQDAGVRSEARRIWRREERCAKAPPFRTGGGRATRATAG